MNVLFSMMRISFGIFFFSHLAFGMDKPQEKFDCFGQLKPELQLLVFAHADNKTSFQSMNQSWSKKGSIRNHSLFTKDFCAAAYSGEKGQDRLIGIVLHAAYNRNHEGVVNIVKNTAILEQTPNRAPYLFVDKYEGKPHILDLAGIAFHNQDEKLMALLQQYKVSAFTPGQTVCVSGILTMPCIAGDSQIVRRLINLDDRIDEVMVDQCLKLSVDFDNGKCINALLRFVSIHKVKIDKALFERACVKHSLKALEELLQAQRFDVNKVDTFCSEDYQLIHCTFLDTLIHNAEKDSRYNELIALFRKYGAKTAAEIAEQEQQKKEQENNTICRLQ